MAKRTLVVGNWKRYIESPEEAREFAQALRKRARSYQGTEVWLAPSFTLVPVVAGVLKGAAIKVGAQSLSPQEGPKHTGEISAAMLKSAGATFAIVGHSEQRAAGISNEAVRAQLAAALSGGLTGVLCVGELARPSAEPKADDRGDHFAYIEEQLRSAFAGVQSLARRVVVAYEPVWAIGGSEGSAMSPAQLQETVIFIRKVLADLLTPAVALRVPVLYGGSAGPGNARALVDESGVAGLLVGHESAVLGNFIEILRAVK